MAMGVRVGGVVALAMGAAVLCLGPSEIAFAATTFAVNSTANTPDAIPGDGICDDGMGACTLGAAVGEAASAPTCLDPVEIHFSVSGQIDAGIEYHVAAGSPCANPSLSIIGPGADSLILSGGVSASGYAYDYPPDYFSPVKTFLGLQGVHVSGELHFNEAAASLADLIADGLIETAGSGSLSITGSSVGPISNSGYGPVRGPAYGSITVADSTTGRISSHNGSVSLARVHVSGGVRVTGDPGVFTGAGAQDSLIEGSPGCGVSAAGSVGLVRTTVRNNAGCGGGAGYNAAAFPSTWVEDSTISGNGGVGVASVYGGHASIVRSTIARNRGGGIASSQPSARISISDSIVAENTVGGEPADCAGESYPGSNTAIRSLIGSTAGCSISHDGNLIGVDPLLGPLADNGGLTPTHALLAGSPAIDAVGACTGTDQRGVPRPQGAACDMGAFEFACGNGAVDLGEQCDDGTPGDGDCCSANCRFEDAGTSCVDDREPFTGLVCDGSGTCGPSGTTTSTEPTTTSSTSTTTSTEPTTTSSTSTTTSTEPTTSPSTSSTTSTVLVTTTAVPVTTTSSTTLAV
jgi:cysteine-rich repeat protein